MLLVLRSLWEAITGQERGLFGGKKRKLPIRKTRPRRVAEWSEAVAPAFVPEIVVGAVGVAANPRIGFVATSIGVPIIGVAGRARSPSAPNLSIATAVTGVTALPDIGLVNVDAEIGLFDYEIAALLAA